MPEEIIKPKKSFVRRFWWIGVFLVFVLGGTLTFASYQGKKHNQELQAAKEKEKSANSNIASSDEDKNCPKKIIFKEKEAVVTKADGVETSSTLAEGEELLKKCPGTEKNYESSPAVAVSSNTSSSSNSTSSPTTSNSASQSSSNGQTSSTSTPSQTESPQPATLAKLDYGTVVTPYFNEADIISVNEAYSMRADNPYWGFVHPGVDFMVDKNIRVRASIGGTIGNITYEKSSGQMGWHAGFCIDPGKENSVCYNLETFGSSQSVGDRLSAGLKIKQGDTVKQGDEIGTLIFGGSGAHIDFGVTEPGTRICPEPYFTAEAKDSVLRLIHILQPTWPMCDPG